MRCPIKVKNFTTIESEYGPFIVNRHCAYQAETLIKTGRPHIQDELNKILAIVNTLPEQCVVVDAGANIGLVAMPVAQLLVAKQGVVHAFEPQRMLSYALCGSAALNDLENLQIYNQALGALTGSVSMDKLDYTQAQDFGLFSLANKQPAYSTSEVDTATDVVTIDSLNLPRLDFLKADVEGMEIDVLQGARCSLERYLPWCWVEYWQVDIAAIKAQFAGLDYQFYVMDKLNLLCAPTGKLTDSMLNINAKQV